MNTISAITISAIFTTITLLLSLNHSVSAWTIYTTTNNKAQPLNLSSRRWIANRYHSTATVYSTPDDEISSDDGGDSSEEDITERRRKRDILKRTLGISSSSSPSDTDGNGNEVVKKLNTDNLFKGMPPINSILGTSSALPNVGIPDDLSSSNSQSSTTPQSSTPQSTSKQTEFEKQGQLHKELDLLTPSEKADLELKYNTIKLQSEGLVSDELEKGNDGSLGKFLACLFVERCLFCKRDSTVQPRTG